MTKMTGSTAILIFSRTAAQEAAVKTFDGPSGKSGNALIARGLIRRTLRTARSTGLPVFLHYDRQDKNTRFGARLADAIESVFDRGFARVIAIGADSPELQGRTLLDAGHKLDERPIVLGPAADGGVYLIGFDRAAYQRAQFIDLPWQTGRLQQVWRAQIATTSGGALWLETLRDVDHGTDFKDLLKRLGSTSALFRFFISILASYTNRPVPQRLPTVFCGFRATASLRGPPCRGRCQK
jgi:uncharacterized protein